jgi:hypothetical protein
MWAPLFNEPLTLMCNEDTGASKGGWSQPADSSNLRNVLYVMASMHIRN